MVRPLGNLPPSPEVVTGWPICTFLAASTKLSLNVCPRTQLTIPCVLDSDTNALILERVIRVTIEIDFSTRAVTP